MSIQSCYVYMLSCLFGHVNTFLKIFFGGFNMPTLSERLIELKESKNLLQKDIAKAINLSLRSYQRYEYGEREPT